MPPSADPLLEIARHYWPSSKDHEFALENPPEYTRLCELWEQKLEQQEAWWAFLSDLERALPDFTIGDATATVDASFRCAAYPASNRQSSLRWAIVGCVSILAPIYTVYGVRYGYRGAELLGEEVLFEPLPPEMRSAADLIARKLEATFKVDALPRELAQTPIPLFVHQQEPPHTTLFHAFFASRPERVP